jgi:hypothetical protein
MDQDLGLTISYMMNKMGDSLDTRRTEFSMLAITAALR